MAKIEATQAQEEFSNVLSRVESSKERIIIESEGQTVAAVISYADLERLEALEEARDIADLHQAMAESDNESYSVEEVIAYYNKIYKTNFTVENVLNDKLSENF